MPILLAVLLHVSAQSVQFYADRFVIEARGGVTVREDGATLRGDVFSMDCKLNRFVLAGHVRIEQAHTTLRGAAAAQFFDYGRTYFISLDGGADRWTFEGNDFTQPVKGRRMPGDAFAFADTAGAKVFASGSAVTIGTREFVRFDAPVPQIITFSDNPHLQQNSLSGADLDGTWNFAGNGTSLSALHARYDSQNHAYLAFEQHLSDARGYAVFSVNPLTRSPRQYNVIAAQQLTPSLQLRVFEQDIAGSLNDTMSLTQALKHSSLQLTHAPGIETFDVRTFTNRVGSLPLFASVSYGLAYGVGGETHWQPQATLDLHSPSIKVGDASLDAAVADTIGTPFARASATLSRSFGRHLTAYGGYEFEHGGWSRLYTGPQLYRTALANLTYTNGSNVSAWILARKHADIPDPASGVFPLPPPDALGRPVLYPYAGEPPYDLTGDVRLRLNAHTSIDVQRTYFFNFQGRGFGSGFAIQLLR